MITKKEINGILANIIADELKQGASISTKKPCTIYRNLADGTTEDKEFFILEDTEIIDNLSIPCVFIAVKESDKYGEEDRILHEFYRCPGAGLYTEDIEKAKKAHTEYAYREEIRTIYAEHDDMTFIMKDIYKKGELVSSKVVGFYYGEPDDNSTEDFNGSLTQVIE